MTTKHIVLFILCTGLSFQAQSATQPESTDAREEALFGGEETETRTELEDDLFGEATDSDAPTEDDVSGRLEVSTETDETFRDSGDRIGDLIASREERLALGGGFYWDTQWRFEEDGGWDPTVLSPALMSLYLDARPNDDLRLYTRGRVLHQMSFQAQSAEDTRTRAELDQLWLKTHADNQVYFTFGLQPVRWGVGRVWNPTDFLNATQKDPFALVDTRGGLPLVKVHIPFEAQGANLYGIVNWDSLQEMKKTYAALRGEILLGTAELTLSAAAGKGSPTRLATDLSTPLGPLDLRLEASWTQGVRYADGWEDLAAFVQPGVDVAAPLEDYLRALVGLEWAINYSDTRSFFIGAEYFYNQAGTTDPDNYLVTLARGDGTFLYLGQHYVAAYIVFPGLGPERNYSAFVNTVMNLNDNTALVRADFRASLYRNLSLALSLSHYVGDSGEFRFAFEVPPVPGVDGLEDGIQVRATTWVPQIAIQMGF